MRLSIDEATRLLDSAAALVRRSRDVPSLYDRLAPTYDALRGLWVKLVGGPAERALVDDLAAAFRKCCTVGDGIVPPAAAASNRPRGRGV